MSSVWLGLIFDQIHQLLLLMFFTEMTFHFLAKLMGSKLDFTSLKLSESRWVTLGFSTFF